MHPATPGAASAEERAARFLGHYELLREIGRGGMATLHVARHLHLGILVAVKRMLPAFADAALVLRRFRNEAMLVASVRHPNVVQVHDYGIDGAVPYLVMEFIEGEPLAAALASGAPLPVRRAVDQLLYALSGVFAAHSAGVVHRDLKPQNIYVRRRPGGQEEAVIIDFGVAKRVLDANVEDFSSKAALTSSGATVGTAAYMAPEQILRAKDAGPAADQYALGVTLYQCLTGKQPFFGASSYEIMHAALHAPVERPSRIRPEIPRELDEIVGRAMHRRPEARFPSVHAFGEALLPFAGASSSLAWRADVLRTRPSLGKAGAPGDTLSERSVDGAGNRPERLRSARGAVLFAVTGALVGIAIGAGWHRYPAKSERSLPLQTHCNPEFPLSSVAAPSGIQGAAAEPRGSGETRGELLPNGPGPRTFLRPHDSRFSRGTNGAPILE